MESDRQWVIVRIDGKVAAISTDYRELASLTTRLAKESKPKYSKITADTVEFEDIWNLRKTLVWEDIILFGTEFQKSVWRRLWELTHGEDGRIHTPRLISYSDFADLCQNRAGVRAVAHAVGLNPLAVLIPCHLVVPKEAIDKIQEIKKKAETTIFKGDDLCLDKILRDTSIDYGEYALGRKLKRELIVRELL